MKTKNLVALSLVVIFCVVVAFAILPSIPLDFSNSQSASYSGFIDIWHIESFEGGSGSRSTWLKRRALEFEKQYEGLLMHITTYTEEQALQKLAEGSKFDVISFSYGVGSWLLSHLLAYEGSLFGIFDNFVDSGQVGQSTFAVPYMSGIYGLFARKSDIQRLGSNNTASLVDNAFKLAYDKKVGKNTVSMRSIDCGFATVNSPLTALAVSVSGVASLNVNYNQTQYEAYQKFVANNSFAVLLGTQRDMFRLKNRMSQAKIEQLVFEPLEGFCDLVQYLAISKTIGEQKPVATKFVEYILSKKSQEKLADIAMFSVVCTYFSDEWYVMAENALQKCAVPNAFTSQEALESLRFDALQKFQ